MNKNTQDTVKPVDPEEKASELRDEDLDKVAGGGEKVVGSSSNIKNNLVGGSIAPVVGSSSNIKNN